MEYKDICYKVIEIARQAGEYIASQSERFSFGDVEFKGAHDMVSYVDKEAERIVVQGLSELSPGAGFITEEGTATHNEEHLKWIIDPLDGTTNFIHGLPPYCVSIALLEGDELVVGVVYEITRKEMFYAWKGSDAYMNGKRITTSRIDKLTNALVAVGFSHSVVRTVPEVLSQMKWYQRNTDGIRRLGSSTADLVYVACGRVDAFAQLQLSPWDVAAGALIVERAGGRVSDNRGGGNYVFGGEIVATNPYIYDEFLKTVDIDKDNRE